ncbi:uncharacterized protein Tco025E_09455 [Trypanosoma conorhini]|uniref:Uncharacterized protein n=1 Tax=Trypanosoma conorhini TaxID=83891 RepID=A0A422MW67_9TRYP|nr:uncharacterized protein Tco025E_09455 [Trypanosoma conorhini]RNE97447.1 hypothetical protein Tco025E_09455 [Trypanosoma conorhini]
MFAAPRGTRAVSPNASPNAGRTALVMRRRLPVACGRGRKRRWRQCGAGRSALRPPRGAGGGRRRPLLPARVLAWRRSGGEGGQRAPASGADARGPDCRFSLRCAKAVAAQASAGARLPATERSSGAAGTARHPRRALITARDWACTAARRAHLPLHWFPISLVGLCFAPAANASSTRVQADENESLRKTCVAAAAAANGPAHAGLAAVRCGEVDDAPGGCVELPARASPRSGTEAHGKSGGRGAGTQCLAKGEPRTGGQSLRLVVGPRWRQLGFFWAPACAGGPGQVQWASRPTAARAEVRRHLSR